MKVLEVESVVPRLIDIVPIELLLAGLELNRKDDTASDHHGVDPRSESRDIKFQEEVSLDCLQ
jgi:hypothetical protein